MVKYAVTLTGNTISLRHRRYQEDEFMAELPGRTNLSYMAPEMFPFLKLLYPAEATNISCRFLGPGRGRGVAARLENFIDCQDQSLESNTRCDVGNITIRNSNDLSARFSQTPQEEDEGLCRSSWRNPMQVSLAPGFIAIPGLKQHLTG